MKHRIFFIGVLLLIISNTKGQGLNVGIELGSNIIPIEKTDLGRNFHIGPYAGVSVKYDFSEKLSISSGLFFSQRKKMYFSSDTSLLMSAFDDFFSFLGGGSMGLDSLLDIPGVDLNVYEKTKGIATENYIELPVMVSYTLRNISVSAGPYIGFLMNGKKKEEIRTTTPLLQVVDISTFDTTGFISSFLPPADETVFDESSSIDNLKRITVGAAFGLGYSMDNVRFNLNYTMSFDDYRIDRGEDEKDVHKSIRVSVSYFFGDPNKNAEPSL